MSAVNNNAFTSGFPVTSAAASEFSAVGHGSLLQQTYRSSDSIGPIAQPEFSSPPDGAGAWSDSNNASDSGLSGFNAIMNGFVNALQNMLANIGGQFGFTPSSAQSATPAQTFFTNASADSVGDPHETFDGTPGSGGANVEAKWDSMNSHADLLDSNSIDGGYRVSTTVSPAKAEGVTQNAQSQVALDGGATKITMNADGSYSVLEHGHATTLAQGRAHRLGNGESVTLDADSSLRVTAKNDAGGSLVTTLTASGGGVDVKTTATNVDLGGYLVTHNDEPVATPQYGAAPQAAPISYAYDAAPSSEVEERGVFMV